MKGTTSQKKERLTLAIMGVSAYKPDPENSCLCWHCTIACNRLGEVDGEGVKPLPKNAPKLWSDALRQWTKSVVVSSLSLRQKESIVIAVYTSRNQVPSLEYCKVQCIAMKMLQSM
jgi:hypothetical protein